jgi:hypothetical protein
MKYFAHIVSMAIQHMGVILFRMEPVISPTYIYSTITADIHYFVYFAKQKYFAFKVIS